MAATAGGTDLAGIARKVSPGETGVDMIYLSADHHWDHANIIKFCDRPYSSVEAMNEDMILKWNERVNPEDWVYYLGDFAMHRRTVEKIRPRLNGQICLIRGNHDCKESDNLLVTMPGGRQQQAFVWVKDVYMLKYHEMEIWCSHYPHLSWPKSFHGSVSAHGHIHNNVDYSNLNLRLVNVGVDVWGFYPVTFEEAVHKVHKAPANIA